jgi:uncharacterized protein YndB with AHSA1/START domain
MAHYEFRSAWLIEAPRETVWDAIRDAGQWPSWWRGVVSSEELTSGGTDGVGRRYRVRWRSLVPYAITFEFEVAEVDAPAHMAGRAYGELFGTGTWRLSERAGITCVTYDWRVGTARAWMNAVAPVARPVFKWNHDWVMARGAEGLAERLGARLIAAS